MVNADCQQVACACKATPIAGPFRRSAIQELPGLGIQDAIEVTELGVSAIVRRTVARLYDPGMPLFRIDEKCLPILGVCGGRGAGWFGIVVEWVHDYTTTAGGETPCQRKCNRPAEIGLFRRLWVELHRTCLPGRCDLIIHTEKRMLSAMVNMFLLSNLKGAGDEHGDGDDCIR